MVALPLAEGLGASRAGSDWISRKATNVSSKSSIR